MISSAIIVDGIFLGNYVGAEALAAVNIIMPVEYIFFAIALMFTVGGSVTRKLIIGTQEQLEDCLLNSEDSDTINTSFVERDNLTIRCGNSYLHRKTASHARDVDLLDGSLSLQMCHYNFIRPHLALRFGKEIRTPAMQAGIVSRKLTFRDIFTSREVLFLCLIIWMLIRFDIHRKKLTGRIG